MAQRKRKQTEARPAVHDAGATQPLVEGEMLLVQVAGVETDDSNHRDPPGEAEIDALAASLARYGQLQPVGVAYTPSGRIRLVWGHRRLLAARRLGWTHIRAVRCEGAESAIQEFRAEENLQRDDLHPLEICRAVSAIVGAHLAEGKDEPQAVRSAAERLARSESWVRSHMVLVRLGGKARELTESGHLPIRYAREIAKLASEDAQSKVAESCFASDFTGRKRGIDPSRLVVTIEKVRRMVGERLRSLHGVPWALDVPFAGGPACDACPSNTANAAGLFEAEGDTAPERASCLDAVCFGRKEKRAELTITRALASKTLAKAVVDGRLTPSAAERVCPEGVKPATFARRAVQQHAPTKKPAKAASGKSEGDRKDATWRAVDAWRAQRRRLSDAYGKSIDAWPIDSAADLLLTLWAVSLDDNRPREPGFSCWSHATAKRAAGEIRKFERGATAPWAGVVAALAEPSREWAYKEVAAVLLASRPKEGRLWLSAYCRSEEIDLPVFVMHNLLRRLGVEVDDYKTIDQFIADETAKDAAAKKATRDAAAKPARRKAGSTKKKKPKTRAASKGGAA
ncbi:MAG: hypothetical protein AMXMBFR77_26620 [Phycisphaerales bacterium]